MEDPSLSIRNESYKYCKAKLSLFSLITLTALSGFCGGISWSIILCLLDSVGMITLERLDNFLANILMFPMFGAFGSGLFAIIGYPIYSWVIKNIRGATAQWNISRSPQLSLKYITNPTS
jgi:hypothetical protein